MKKAVNEGNEEEEKEPVLLVPPRLTKSSYAILVDNNCVGRPWHPEGRYGSRTHKVLNDDDDGNNKDYMVGLPLLKSSPKLDYIKTMMQKQQKNAMMLTSADDKTSTTTNSNGNISSLQDLLQAPKVKLVFKTPVPSNRIPKPEIVDGTVHKELKKENFDMKLKHFLELRQKTGKQEREKGMMNRKRKSALISSSKESARTKSAFTFCELFAGIGGFGTALERLGGKCIFASEIYTPSIKVFSKNLDLSHIPQQRIWGDIWTIDTKDIPKDFDLLVAGFPCQPFSNLGKQPGLSDDKIISGRKYGDSGRTNEDDAARNNNGNADKYKSVDDTNGRGQLFTQIVRVLKDCQPRAFLLENVPGLLSTPAYDEDGTKTTAWEEIKKALIGVGYDVCMEVISSRGLTAQARKRLYIVGILKQQTENNDGRKSFRYPFVPDLGLRAVDVLHTHKELEDSSISSFVSMGVPESLVDVIHQPSNRRRVSDKTKLSSTTTPASLFRISNAQFDQLQNRSKSWKPAKLAWNNKTCDTIDSHYGISVGKGNSQLVPSLAPFHPRRFTPRECARIMGFPNSFILGEFDQTRFCCHSQNNDSSTNTENSSVFVSDRELSSFYGFIKEQYYMLGNAVCPPIIAVIAGAILDVTLGGENVGNNINEDDGSEKVDWLEKGLLTGIDLSLDAVSPEHLDSVCGRLHSSFCTDTF